MNIEISQVYWILNIWLYMIIYEYMCTWIRYIFVRNYDFIYMIFEQIDYKLILIPKPMWVIYWYSDTQPKERLLKKKNQISIHLSTPNST